MHPHSWYWGRRRSAMCTLKNSLVSQLDPLTCVLSFPCSRRAVSPHLSSLSLVPADLNPSLRLGVPFCKMGTVAQQGCIPSQGSLVVPAAGSETFSSSSFTLVGFNICILSVHLLVSFCQTLTQDHTGPGQVLGLVPLRPLQPVPPSSQSPRAENALLPPQESWAWPVRRSLVAPTGVLS